jgi:hypothetical protein
MHLGGATYWSGGTFMALSVGARGFATMLALATLPPAGCSWIAMSRPPATPVDPTPTAACTTSRLAPALDTVGAVLVGVPSAVVTGVAIATPACTQGQGWDCLFQFPTPGAKAAAIGTGLAFVGLAVVDAVSAANGFTWASRCETIQAQQLACVSGVETSCAALRGLPSRQGGGDPGETCAEDTDCREGSVCFQGHCQARPP